MLLRLNKIPITTESIYAAHAGASQALITAACISAHCLASTWMPASPYHCVTLQERGIRSGTVPAPLVIGLGAACEVAQQEMDYDKQHVTKLARRLYEGITSQVDEVVLNGPGDLEGPDRYIGNLNLSFAYVEGESLIMGLKVNRHLTYTS